jgi:hypothetical protein
MIDKWEFEGDYLSQFDKNYHGTIGDKFCRAIRDGAEDPKAVLDWVSSNLVTNTNPVWQQVAKTTRDYSSEAWDFAQHLLEREALSWDAKQKLKGERALDSEFVKAKMARDKPSWAQLNYLEGLGCDVVPSTKLEASELIDKYVKARTGEKAKAKPKPTRFQPDRDEGDIDLSKVPESDVPW